MKTFDIEELLEKNPQVNRDLLREAQELGRELERIGGRNVVCRLASPHERKRARIIDAAHVIRLQRNRGIFPL